MTLYWRAVSAVVLVAFLAASFRILVIRSPVMVVPNDYAAFLVMLPLIKWSMGRLAFLLCMAAAVATSIAVDSRLCLLLSVIGLLWGERGAIRWNGKTAVTGTVAVVLMVALAIQTGFISNLLQLPTSRIPVWNAAVHQIQEAPLLGSGAYAFGPFHAEHIAQANYSDFIAVDSRYMPWAHNLFLDVAVAFGIPASATLLALLLAVLLKSTRAGNPLGNSIACSVLLFLLASMVEFTHLRFYTIALIAVFAGYLLSTPRHNEGEG